MENNINKVITVENGVKYMILDQTEYNGDTYMFTSELSTRDEPMMNFSIFKAVNNGDLDIEKVTDESLFKELSKIFRTNLVNN